MTLRSGGYSTGEYDDENLQNYLLVQLLFQRLLFQRLLLKVEKYGIKGLLHAWISQFLQNRSMSVCVRGCLSDKASVQSEVPQGSVMGPIPFLIYINDIVKEVDLTLSFLVMILRCGPV